MGKTLLLELGLEEMPAHVVSPAREQLKEKAARFLKEQRLTFAKIEAFSTPRRLTLRINEISEKQPDLETEMKGPAKKIALDSDGNWTKAAQGFARGQGAAPDDIVFKEVKGVEYAYVKKFVAGKKAEQVLTGLEEVLKGLTFPVTMRWANYDFEYIRPVHWIVALLDHEVLPLHILDIESGKTSRGHRFLGEDTVIEDPYDYEAQLEKEFVIADASRRMEMIVDQAESLAQERDWLLDLDDDLLEEVNNLVEYPTVFIGTFDRKYLEVPEEVLVTSMKEHQRYFEVRDQKGNLLPYFIGVRNGDRVMLDNVARGNEKVLTARLDDAEFFYQEDLKTTIVENVNKLAHVTFHDKIGTMTEKMERVAVLSELIADQVGMTQGEKANLYRASNIYKFDLVTNMVGEFPELQGIMGEKYALLAGEDQAVATAIREHYLPTSAEGELPQTQVGAVLALSDKLDSILAFFNAGMIPSGSNDPYALRRQAYGIVRIIADRHWPVDLAKIEKEFAAKINGERKFGIELEHGFSEVNEFFESRLRQLLMRDDLRPDVIEAAVTSQQPNYDFRLESAHIISEKISTEAFKKSVEALTRVGNLAAKNEADAWPVDESLFENASEKALHAAVAEIKADPATRVEFKNYAESLLALEAVITAYFDETMVMVEDEKVRQNRLNQLTVLDQLTEQFANLHALNVKE